MDILNWLEIFLKCTIHSYRQTILEGSSCKTLILEMIQQQVEENLETIVTPEYGPASFAAWAGTRRPRWSARA